MKEIVSMQGRITIDSADQMRRRLANALRTHPMLVAVDLSASAGHAAHPERHSAATGLPPKSY
jgi:hypothetical protein